MKRLFNDSRIVYWYLLSVMLLLVSCTHQKDTIKSDIEKLQSRKICIPLDSMLCYNSSVGTASGLDSCKYKLIIYTDNISCSSCSLYNIFDWDSFIEPLRSTVDFIFILSPNDNDMEKVKQILMSEKINHTIYIDTCAVFIRNNPQIPDKSFMHTFLLNDKDSVVLVGNPQSNSRIKELFMKIIKNKQCK